MPSMAIRTYGLFGETANLPDPMHIETIAARSALHDWELAPHRHVRLHQLLLLSQQLLPLRSLTLLTPSLTSTRPF